MINEHGGNIAEAMHRFGLPADNIVDFSASMNPLGMSDGVRRVLHAGVDDVRHYPDQDSIDVRTAIALFHNLKPANILPGNGATELIYALCRALGAKRFVIPVPTFSEYERAAVCSGGRCVFIDTNERSGFRIDTSRLFSSARKGDMIIVCNPNNPTGVLIPRHDLCRMAVRCREHGIMLLVDESFMDFTSDGYSMAQAAAGNQHLVVVKSVTKIAAIPGLRAGYIVGSPASIRKVRRKHYPWSMNVLAEKAVIEFLKDKAYIEKTRRYAAMQKRYLVREMKRMNWLVFPTCANFILVKMRNKGCNGRTLYDMLGRQGILIRVCGTFRGLNDQYIRIAVRKRRENERLIKALDGYCNG